MAARFKAPGRTTPPRGGNLVQFTLDRYRGERRQTLNISIDKRGGGAVDRCLNGVSGAILRRATPVLNESASEGPD
jgi:hypothetical protein